VLGLPICTCLVRDDRIGSDMHPLFSMTLVILVLLVTLVVAEAPAHSPHSTPFLTSHLHKHITYLT
jgi:hypothetical protein